MASKENLILVQSFLNVPNTKVLAPQVQGTELSNYRYYKSFWRQVQKKIILSKLLKDLSSKLHNYHPL